MTRTNTGAGLRIRMEGGLEALEEAAPMLEAARRGVEAQFPTTDDVRTLEVARRAWPDLAPLLERARGEVDAEQLVRSIDASLNALHARVGGERAGLFDQALRKLRAGVVSPAPTETRLAQAGETEGSWAPWALASLGVLATSYATHLAPLLVLLAPVAWKWREARLRHRWRRRWVLLPDRLHSEGHDVELSRLRVQSWAETSVVVAVNGEVQTLWVDDGPRVAATLRLLTGRLLPNLESRPRRHTISSDGLTTALTVDEGTLTFTAAALDALHAQLEFPLPVLDLQAVLFLLAHVPGADWARVGPQLDALGAMWDPREPRERNGS